jgi:hypothetical protein
MRTGVRGEWTSAEVSHQEHSRVAKLKAVGTESQDRPCGCYSKVDSSNHWSVFDNMYLGKVKPCSPAWPLCMSRTLAGAPRSVELGDWEGNSALTVM